MDTDEDPWLTYREAAKRVNRSVLTIKRWRRKALLPMGWDVRSGQRVRVVRLTALQQCLRDRLNADPIHQKRLARLRQEADQS